MFKIKDGYKQELKPPEIMKLFRGTKKLTDKTKNGENVQSLDKVEVVLVQYNLSEVSTKSEVIYTFTPNKSNAYLLDVDHSNLVFLQNSYTEFDDTILTITDQNGRPLEIKNKIN